MNEVSTIDTDDGTLTVFNYDGNTHKCAHYINGDEKKSFYIRRGRGKLYNPYQTAARDHGAPYWKLVSVSEYVYDLYIQFLFGKSEYKLRQAEREI